MKRAVWRNVQFENSYYTAQEYAALAKQLRPNFEIEFISKNKIDQQSQLLDSKWEQVMAVPRVHCV